MPATYKVNLLSPCLSFDGVDDRVTAANVDLPNDRFTVEAWILTDTVALGRRAVISAKEAENAGFVLTVNDVAGKARISARLTDGVTPVWVSVDSVTTLVTGRQYHLAGVWDGGADELRLYLDGVLDASTVFAGKSLVNTAGPTTIGAKNSNDLDFSDGLIDEVRVWDAIRTQAQLADNRFRRLAGTESGLVRLWRMDEATGTQAKDATSNASHGTISGAAWADREVADIAADVRELAIDRGRSEAIRGQIVTGQARISLNNVVGKTSSPALNFDGVDDQVQITNPSAALRLTSFTLEAWIKTPNAGTGRRRIVSRQSVSDYWLMALKGNLLELGVGVPPNQDLITRGAALNDDQWHHVAVVKDNGAATGRWYIDGVKVGTATLTALGASGAGDALIGTFADNPLEFFTGRIDDVRIWNIARTATQIQNNRKRRLAGNESGLVGYWRFDEGSGTQAQDATANGNHGTITGAAWTTREQAVTLEGTYSPDNPSSKYAGLLRPFLKLRITATSEAVTKDRFTGYILRYDPETRLGEGPEDERIVSCYLEDRFRILRNRKVTTAILADQKLGDIVITILDAAGVPAGERTLATTVDTAPFALFTNEAALDALRKPIEAGQYAHYIDPSGKYRLENRYWGLETTTFKTYGAEMVDFKPVYDEAPIINYIQVKSQPRKKDAAFAVVAKLKVPYELAPSQSVPLFLEYIDPSLSSAVRAPADEMQTPVATTDYTANSASDGTGTDKTAQLGVSVSFFAEQAKVTLTNNDAASIFVTKFELRGKSLRKQTPILREAKDTQSQEDFQKHDAVMENDLIGNDLYAKDFADFLILDNKDVVPIAQMTLRNIFPDMLEIDLGTVIRINESLTGVSFLWAVNGLSEAVLAPGFEHSVTYRLRKHIDYEWKIFDKDPEGRLDQRRLAF